MHGEILTNKQRHIITMKQVYALCCYSVYISQLGITYINVYFRI